HTISANFLGNDSFAPSGSTLSGGQRIAKMYDLVISDDPSVVGQPVTFTLTTTNREVNLAELYRVDQDGNFMGPLRSATPTNGSASFTLSDLPVGKLYVQAIFDETGLFGAGASDILTQIVNPASTTTSVAAVPSPSVFGKDITFTAIVAPVSPASGTPSGSVQFVIDGVESPPLGLIGGVAPLQQDSLSLGNHTISVNYLGDGSYLPSSGALAGGQTVNQASTTTELTSSSNPSALGQQVTFTAAVAAQGGGVATGDVQFT